MQPMTTFTANKITNISANGLFIETPRPLIRGDEVIMAFKLDGFDKSLKLRGEIARANQTGIGVTYKNISPHIEEMIRSIVNRMKIFKINFLDLFKIRLLPISILLQTEDQPNTENCRHNTQKGPQAYAFT